MEQYRNIQDRSEVNQSGVLLQDEWGRESRNIQDLTEIRLSVVDKAYCENRQWMDEEVSYG